MHSRTTLKLDYGSGFMRLVKRSECIPCEACGVPGIYTPVPGAPLKGPSMLRVIHPLKSPSAPALLPPTSTRILEGIKRRSL